MTESLPTPVLLRGDNFTPTARTPWGGTKIVSHYKPDLIASTWDARSVPAVGESWEISVEPDFPSIVEADGIRLDALISRAPEVFLGAEARLGRRGTGLLVKLLDAADELSVQVHPSDDYGALAPDQSGKPESWYVLEAEPGAGIYVGLRNGVRAKDVAQSLEREGDVAAMLYFVPVLPGDFFVIEAGTPHAIGRGVTVVEPQRVVPGKRGVTYRFWDWNRRYDDAGRPGPSGKPRALHVRDALAVTDFDSPRETALLARIRVRAGEAEGASSPREERLCGPTALDALKSRDLRVSRLFGTGNALVEPLEWLRGLTVVRGAVRLRGAGYDMRVTCGRSAVLPASLSAVNVTLDDAHAIVTSVAR